MTAHRRLGGTRHGTEFHSKRRGARKSNLDRERAGLLVTRAPLAPKRRSTAD